MDTTFYIVDDDLGIQKILSGIITSKNLGKLVGISDNGKTAIDEINKLNPDIVLVDLLMPQIDGIGMVMALKKLGSKSAFIMISQVDTKDMIASAYEEGIDFYINKPINVIEVLSVVKSVKEKLYMTKVLESFENVMRSMGTGSLREEAEEKKLESNDKRAQLKKILAPLGILGEAGSHDIIEMIIWMTDKNSKDDNPLIHYRLSDACNYIKQQYLINQGIDIPIGTIEQRIRRTIKNTLKNLANLGIENYYDDVFVSYSSVLFEFGEVRREMDFIKGKSNYSGKINVKKFIEGIQSLLLDKVK